MCNKYSVGYYVPHIPNVWSTDRYQHAMAISRLCKRSLLISNTEPPKKIRTLYKHCKILKNKNKVGSAFNVARMSERILGAGSTLVTAAHEYEGAMAGLFAKWSGLKWIADLFETPAAPRLNLPYSIHQITTRINPLLINTADLGIHSFHPNTPYQYCKKKKFLTNGAPVDIVEPNYNTGKIKRIVLVGSRPRKNRGGEYLIKAVKLLGDKTLKVDVCGKAGKPLKQMVKSYNLQNRVTFHGWVSHRKSLDIVSKGDIGYAVLPPRTDWKYAPPIKIGEYLASGTVPLVSRFPGNKYIAGDSAIYTSPSKEGVLSALNNIVKVSNNKLVNLKKRARKRGEQISWSRVRRRFRKLIAEEL